MNKFQKLSQISKDIEILENAGKIEAADVLHKKFIKEAQYAMPQMMMPQMMMPQMMSMMPQMMPMTMARPVAPGAVARPVVAPAAVAKPVGTPAPVQQGQVNPPATGITPPTPSPAPSPAPYPAPTPKPSPGNMQIEPPNPMDDTQRGYGDQQSKNQEMQYLMNEKKRLEEMGATQPNSPYYQQYQTILEMIKRNQGGSVIKKSENMNKLQKLAQLNQDIELLETAGKFKAAEILQKKFVKEAQLKSARDLMTEFNTLAQNPNADFDNLVKWWGTNFMNYSPDDQAYVSKTIQDRSKQRQNMGTFSTTIKPQSQTLSSFETSVPAVQPQNSNLTNPNGELSDQVKAEQFDIVLKGVGETIETGKQNMDIQAKYRMTPQENEAENQLYSSTINEIKKLLATGNETQRNYARGLYQNTRQKFKNLKRQHLYDQQYAAIDRNPNKKQ